MNRLGLKGKGRRRSASSSLTRSLFERPGQLPAPCFSPGYRLASPRLAAPAPFPPTAAAARAPTRAAPTAPGASSPLGGGRRCPGGEAVPGR